MAHMNLMEGRDDAIYFSLTLNLPMSDSLDLVIFNRKATLMKLILHEDDVPFDSP